ncbi:hypothetical protein CI109_103737 [Kwoniella shandongensis]|uniref:Cytoplasmic protein n=1 Tax=Kwoniella shandongensis TaxID=1734106 RepID=A0AAJ8LK27_9TREE
MSRPISGGHRPTHITMPTNNTSFTPTGSPLPTPGGGVGSAVSPSSPRHSFLGFMRTRSRAATITNSQSSPNIPGSPSMDRNATGTVPASRGATSRDPSVGPTSRETGVTRSVSIPNTGTFTSAPLVANGSTTNNDPTTTPAAPPPVPQTVAATTGSDSSVPPKTYRIRLVPHLESQRSLAFDPVIRELLPIRVPPGVTPTVAAQSVTAVGPTVNGRPPALLLKIGRFTDKTNGQLPVPGSSAAAGGSATLGPNGGRGGGQGASLTIAGGGGDITAPKVAFKSKVVSRGHAEIWCEPDGKFYIRDTASSSGTFLNHIRLSSPNTESRPTMLNDGDILQLGVDYQGGTEEMFRCVKIRVEVGREWQRAANEFNTNALKQLKALGGGADSKSKSNETPSKKAKASVTDCCICLFSVTVCQSLFIAPCSHVFHYKCIRPLLLQHHPGFSCPLCRTFANLEEDVEIEEIASRRASIISRRPSNHSIRLPTSSDNPSSPTSANATAPGQPSTSISLAGAGEGSASVDQLLNGESRGGESGTASEEGMTGSSALARQQTAVASPPVLGEGGGDIEMDVPEAVREEDEEGNNSQDVSNSTSEGRTLDNETDPIGTLPVSISLGGRIPTSNAGQGGEGTLSFSQAATPMNDTFLSTLAPGMHQRLALAEGMSTTGSGSAEGSDIGMSEGDGSEGRPSGERQGQESGLTRGDIDMMMFT